MTALTDRERWRVLDANGNRLREGLRVIEEVFRFCLPHSHRLAELKALRHAAAALLKELPYAELLAARDTDGDAGKALPGALNAARGDVRDLLRANFARAGEAARVLEEFGAGWNPAWSARARELRFAVYRLEKALGVELADGPG